MSNIYKNTETLALQEGQSVYTFCILCTGRIRASEKACFQAYLYMGEPGEKKTTDLITLYRWAYKAALDESARKDGKPLSKKKMENALGQEISTELWQYLKKPLKEKLSLYLFFRCGFSETGIASVLKISTKKVQKIIHGADEKIIKRCMEELKIFDPRTDWLDHLGDDVLLRYEERSVPFENKLLRIRSAIDRAVPYIALALILLSIAAMIYTSKINAALPVE